MRRATSAHCSSVTSLGYLLVRIPATYENHPLWDRLSEPSKRAGSGAAPGSAFACYRPSLPTLHAPRLLYPLEHLRSLRLRQGLHLDVAAPVGGSERRRRVEFRAAEENHIHGHVVGNHFDDPTDLRQPVVRLLPLNGVLKPGNRLANQFVDPPDGRMQLRHDATNPILDVGVAIRRIGWSTDCTWFACFRHRCALLRRTGIRLTGLRKSIGRAQS